MPRKLILTAFILFCFLMLQASFPVFTLPRLFETSSYENDSVVGNGGFESGLENWFTIGRGLINVTDENMHEGNFSLEISSAIEEQATFYQFVDCPNESYTFTF